MRYATPGAQVETTFTAASGLGTAAQVQVEESVSGDVISAFTHTGVAERHSGLYAATITMPLTAGVITPVWTDGTGFYPDDDITVNASGTPDTTSGADLCSLAEVKADLGLTDSSQDDRLSDLITAAAHAVMDYTHREFAPETTEARDFQVECGSDGLHRVFFQNDDLQSVSAIAVDTDTTVSTTLTTADYQLIPIRAKDGVYQGIRMNLPGGGRIGFPRIVTITGTWGYPSVPSIANRAARATVCDWWRRDQRGGGSTEFDIPGTSPVNIPDTARWILRPLMRKVYA